MFGGARNNQAHSSQSKKRKISNSQEEMMLDDDLSDDLVVDYLTDKEANQSKRKRSIEPQNNTTPIKKVKKGVSKSIFEVLEEVDKGKYEDFRALIAQDKITKLCVNFSSNLNSPHDRSGIYLAHALRDTSVKVLDFTNGRYLDSKAMIQLCAHLQGTQVRAVNFLRCYYDGDFIIEILKALQSSPVKHVELHSNNIKTEHVESIMAIACKQQLLTLDLGYSDIGARGAQIIAKYLPQSSLRCLGLHGCSIEPQGAMAIAKVLKDTNLEKLRIGGGSYFRNGAIKNDGVMAICKALPQSKIKELEVSRCRMDARGFAELMKALPYSQVEKLDIHRNPLTNCLGILEKGLTGSKVTHLEAWDSFGQLNVLKLARMIPKTRLIKINQSIMGGHYHPTLVEDALKSNHRRLLGVPYWLARLKCDAIHGKYCSGYLSFPNKTYENLNEEEQTRFACELIIHAPLDITKHIMSFFPLMSSRKTSTMLSHARACHPHGIEHEEETNTKNDYCVIM